MSKDFAAKPKRFAGAAGGFGPKKSFGDRPSFGGRGGFGGGKSFGGPRKSFGDRPSYGAGRPSFGGGFGQREERPSFEAVCDGCQKDCRVPFRPNGSKPVLCTNCFRKERDGADFSESPRPSYNSRPSFAPREDRGASAGAGVEARLKAIEAKLERILKTLGGDEEQA